MLASFLLFVIGGALGMGIVFLLGFFKPQLPADWSVAFMLLLKLFFFPALAEEILFRGLIVHLLPAKAPVVFIRTLRIGFSWLCCSALCPGWEPIAAEGADSIREIVVFRMCTFHDS